MFEFKNKKHIEFEVIYQNDALIFENLFFVALTMQKETKQSKLNYKKESRIHKKLLLFCF
jgi:hypothetical protein